MLSLPNHKTLMKKILLLELRSVMSRSPGNMFHAVKLLSLLNRCQTIKVNQLSDNGIQRWPKLLGVRKMVHLLKLLAQHHAFAAGLLRKVSKLDFKKLSTTAVVVPKLKKRLSPSSLMKTKVTPQWLDGPAGSLALSVTTSCSAQLSLYLPGFHSSVVFLVRSRCSLPPFLLSFGQASFIS